MKKMFIAIGIIFISLLFFRGVFSSDSGALSPDTMADSDAVGTLAWTSPNNANASDNLYATAKPSSGTQTTHYLKATNFGFTIPSGATIDGIKVEIEQKRVLDDQNGNCKDASVYIVKSDGSIGATNKADLSNNWSTTDTYKSYGSSSDLWGETWEYSDINDADFGVVLSAIITYDTTASVDHIRITVYFSENNVSKVQIRGGSLQIKGSQVKIQ